jgi:glycosyltransferase involved in cell wall biosynthesis
MNILTYSSLYPNDVDPSNGIFVERRLRRLLAYSGHRAAVVAPVPWFPFKAKVFGRYAKLAAVPASTMRHGVHVCYPRYPRLPKIGMLAAPASMAAATAPVVRSLIARDGVPDIIDAHYCYPDGVAAARIARRFGLPFVMTARGSDINVIAAMPGPRRLILEAARNASAVIAVSQALGKKIAALGVPENKVHVLPNGVDLDFFCPGDRDASRARLNFESPTMISVGALKEAKGHDVAISALCHLKDARLVIVGTGEYEGQLKRLVKVLDLGARVTFAGQLDASELREYFRAADCLVLASRREGMPNVVLESLACGTPVIASDVGGIGEVLEVPVCGALLPDRKPQTLAKVWQEVQDNGVDRAEIRRVAGKLSWDSTIEQLDGLMRHCAGTSPRVAAGFAAE